MKKTVFLPSTIFRPIIIAIPIVILLISSIALNDKVDTLFKLYPMIIFCLGALIFTFVFFFRIISVSNDEVRFLGFFSSHDSAIINEGKSLILTLLKNGRINVEVFGNDGAVAELSWLKDAKPRDRYLFKGTAVGGTGTLKRVLRVFGISEDLASKIARSDAFEEELEDYAISSSVSDSGKEVRIRFKRTI